MLKFTMNAKELKSMIDKGVAAINKKASLPALTKLYFQVETDGTVKTLGTDLEHYAEISSKNAWNTSPGVLGIDVEDLKIITKMNGNVTLDDIGTETENKLNVICGNKCVTIPKYDNIDTFLPSMDNTEECVLNVKESWLFETITNLVVYTSDTDSNKIMQTFNFNTSNKRVEALEGHMIGMRVLQDKDIKKENDSLMLHNKCVSVFKRMLDKKSSEIVALSQDKKYIKVSGNNFTYIVRRVDGQYFNVEGMLTKDSEYSLAVNKDDFLAVMKYNCDLLHGDRKPVVLHSENGTLYAYLKTYKYETLDTIEVKNNNMEEEFYIGFNPSYLVDVFSIVDTDYPVCEGKSNKSPLFVYGNEYSFLILPVNIGNEVEDMKQSINRSRVA